MAARHCSGANVCQCLERGHIPYACATLGRKDGDNIQRPLVEHAPLLREFLHRRGEVSRKLRERHQLLREEITRATHYPARYSTA